MKQFYLAFAILTLSTCINACGDANAQGTDCFCKAGYYGNSSDNNSSGSCLQCPNGTNSVDASSATDVTSCSSCLDSNANNNGQNPPSCFCKPGYYGSGQAAGSCTQCPSGTTYTSQPSSTNDVTACTSCLDSNANNNGANPPSCFCNPGLYGSGQGAGSCTQCPSGTTYTTQSIASNDVTACISCLDSNANNNGANPPSCFCNPGYYGFGSTANSCSQCPSGTTYTTQAIISNDVTACTSCLDSNANNNGQNPPSCFCKLGYYGSGQAAGSCTSCPNGTTYTTQATSTNDITACISCLDSNANNDNQNPSSCFCNLGYYGSGQAAGSCTQCPSGTTYTSQASSTNDITACTSCLDSNANNNGANPPSCFCQPGYYGSGSFANSCNQCPNGTTYTTQATAANDVTACTSCLDSNSNNNNQNPPSCFCQPGYYGSGNSPFSCSQCPSGTTYTLQATAANDATACTTCLDSNAISDGNNPPSCFCKPGYYGSGSSANSCSICPIGTTYTVQATSTNDITACTSCLDSNANNNGANPPSCFCNPGYYGTGNTASSCIQCPGQTTYTIQATSANTIAACNSCFDSINATNNNSSTAPACSCNDPNAQYSSDASPVCQCQANFYGTSSSTATSGCTACPSGQTAPAGSTTNVCQDSFADTTTTSSYILIPLLSLLFSILIIF